MKKTINAQIVADSINQMGDRITTYLLTYPRFIHAELMTHRMFSRNSASSRAIPFEKMLKMVEEDPFIPIAWQKDHKGMQGNQYITDQRTIQFKTGVWLNANKKAVESAEELHYNVSVARSMDDIKELDGTSVTKQICNRLLEPFMWHTVLVTSTEWNNFFELRCPKYEYKYPGETQVYNTFKSKKDWLKYNNYKMNLTEGGIEPPQTDLDWLLLSKSQAEIHIQALAESMWDAMNESTPKELKEGEWHIPFGKNMDGDKIETLLHGPYRASYIRKEGDVQQTKIEIATVRCARLSYMTFDNEIDYEKDIQLHDKLLKNKHMSPFEHCARAMNNDEYFSHIKGVADELEDNIDYMNVYFNGVAKSSVGWCNNFKGFIPYRYMIENGLSI